MKATYTNCKIALLLPNEYVDFFVPPKSEKALNNKQDVLKYFMGNVIIPVHKKYLDFNSQFK